MVFLQTMHGCLAPSSASLCLLCGLTSSPGAALLVEVPALGELGGGGTSLETG